jgi:hypothetical protein
MPLQRLTYEFTTTLEASRPRAFQWATDYRPSDFDLNGFQGTRRVERLAENLILLTDTFDSDPFDATPGSPTVKVKLVHLYPDRWSWTATHLSGPAQHSQFLYELSTKGPSRSTLHFTGSQVEQVARPLTKGARERRAAELRREDSELWVRISSALAKELR